MVGTGVPRGAALEPPGLGEIERHPKGRSSFGVIQFQATLLPLRPALGLHVTFKSLRNELCILFPRTVKKNTSLRGGLG